MRLLRTLVLFGLVFALSTDANAAKDKKKGGGIQGTIVSVEADKENKDNGTIKIKVMAGKKGAAAAEAEEKTFKYTKDTKYWKAEGKGGEVAAVLADLTAGVNVAIMASGDPPVADKVTIMGGKKKK